MSRLALLAGLALTLALVPQAMGGGASAPTGLHGFTLRADEPVPRDHTYAQMPAFAWNVTPGASYYQLQLADNQSFSDISILHQDLSLKAPVDSIQMQLPWMNGKPYALWAHVRAVVHGTTTPWSRPFGFNMGWQNVPQQLQAPTGLIRWTPVDGATAYQVWFTNIDRAFSTLTNVADEREYWTLHPTLAKVIKWRVRAVRTTSTTSLPSGISIAPYGPWSDVFTTFTPGAVKGGPLAKGQTLSDVTTGPHALMPGFAWSGADGHGPKGVGDQLWRVYVFSDRNCVNQVMVGALTGEPAWAPREGNALAFPADAKTFDDAAAGKILSYSSSEGPMFGADMQSVQASEDAAGGTSSSSSSGSASASGGSATGATVESATLGQVELPDSGWPTGRYWWTVVPVQIVYIDTTTGQSSTNRGALPAKDPLTIEYHEAEVPQDSCKSGRVWSFGMQSAPVTAAAASTPYASGLVAGPRVVAAANRVPSFTGLPLVTWKPALGAQSYEIQLARRLYPWSAVSHLTSVVPSVVLPLSTNDVGVWYYRVRGVNPNLPANAQKMTWSSPVKLRIAGNQFKVVVG